MIKTGVKTIFLIDNDEDDRNLFHAALLGIDENIKLMEATNAESALLALSSDVIIPDFIFLDLHMPEKNGMECLRELRNLKHLNKVPVIIYTNSTNAEDKEKSVELGANHYIIKPYTIQDTRLVLRNLITTGAPMRSYHLF